MRSGDVMAQVIPLPVPPAAGPAPDESGSGAWDIDDWGRDATLVGLAGRLLRLRWSIAVGGHDRLPTDGPALIVVNSRSFMLTPWFAAIAFSQVTGRSVRFVGRPDVAPHGAIARRLGGLLARPDEVASALRDGQLLVFGATGVLDPLKVGKVDHHIVGAAVRTKSPVFPAAVTVSPVSRSARIELAPAVRPPHRRRGPFAELELADRLEVALAKELDAAGAPRTGTPLDWIPISLSGGR